MGRKTKYSNELATRICANIAGGATYEDACRMEGIATSSYYCWLKKFPEFSQAVKKATVQFKRVHLSKIASADSWQASAWLLERRFPYEYGRRPPVEVMGKDGGPVQTEGIVHIYLPDNGRDPNIKKA